MPGRATKAGRTKANRLRERLGEIEARREASLAADFPENER